MKKIRHLSLFSGCGGMDIGLQGNFKVHKKFINKKTNTNWVLLPKTKIETVFANDIKKSSYNFWQENILKDQSIFKLGSIVDFVKDFKKGKKVFPKNIDLVTGGFPCQDFSVSGLRKGFNSHKSHLNDYKVIKKNESRGKLYLWMREVIAITKPKIFIAENVKGLKNLKHIFETIKSDFKKTGDGYTVVAKELYAPDYGIPQSRKRIFFVGVNNKFIKSKKIKFDINELFPEKEFNKSENLFENLPSYPLAKYFFDDLKEPRKESYDLAQQFYSKAKYIKGLQGQTEVNECGIAPTIRSEHHGNIEFRYLDKSNGGKNLKRNGVSQRRLTVRECARIQTFPDNLKFVFKRKDKNSLSASEGYKLIGDAVPPLLSYKFAKKIEKFLT